MHANILIVSTDGVAANTSARNARTWQRLQAQYQGVLLSCQDCGHRRLVPASALWPSSQALRGGEAPSRPARAIEEEVGSSAEVLALDFSVGDAACAGPGLENSGDDDVAQAEPQQPVRQGGDGVPVQITFPQSAFQPPSRIFFGTCMSFSITWALLILQSWKRLINDIQVSPTTSTGFCTHLMAQL